MRRGVKKNKFLSKSISTVLQNGRSLLDDADYLIFNEPPTTAYFLSLIAQEEIAKAFLLSLSYRGIIPWNKQILRATKDHACKQLICLVLDYLNPYDDEFIDRCILHGERRECPMKVIDAINILRYEKIGRWVSKMWVWAEDPRYDPIALSIAEGKQDKIKQDALYVRLTNDGRIASVPSETTYDYDMVRAEIDKGTRFANFIDHFVNDGFVGLGVDYNKVEEAFTILFTESKEV